nr:transmembrane protein 178B isoform X4 [Columba livia]
MSGLHLCEQLSGAHTSSTTTPQRPFPRTSPTTSPRRSARMSGTPCGFYQTESLCQGDVLLLIGGEQKSCEKGGLKSYGATSSGNHRRQKFFTVASSETKSQHLRQTITSPELMELPSCEALAVVAVLLCQSCFEAVQKQLLLLPL